MDVQVPLKSLLVDGNCRVEDRGLKTHHGQVSLLVCLVHAAFLVESTRCISSLHMKFTCR